jgi:hypothetical protein
VRSGGARAALAAVFVELLAAACGGEEEPEAVPAESTSPVAAVAVQFEGAEAFAICGGETAWIADVVAGVLSRLER